MSISVQQLTYLHPDREILFQDITFSIGKKEKIGLIGNNGCGKSTLLHILSGQLSPASGEIICFSTPYYIPQHFGQYNKQSIAQALNIDFKLQALQSILAGNVTDQNLSSLSDDWEIEERAKSALSYWGLNNPDLFRGMNTLSGGEKTKVFLSGIMIHKPEIILMDEPTNHLDYTYRNKLYEFIESSGSTIIIVSHDRTLLNLLPGILELEKGNINYYAGNYSTYKEEKDLKLESLQNDLSEQEKALRKARKIARETIERKQKHESRGKKNNIKKGVGKMAMDTFQDQAEKSNSKLKDIHTEKLKNIADKASSIRNELSDIKLMQVDFNISTIHNGKILVSAKNINFAYNNMEPLWKENLNFIIRSGERVLIKGGNGSGKTTLLKMITGSLLPTAGEILPADFKYIYLDQDYSIVKDNLTVYEQAQSFNSGLLESEIKTILNRFLFSKNDWDKSCSKLSGGEKMKLALCCLMLNANTPDMIILDEPVNNIDIKNIEILTATIKNYKGTVLLVSHDEYFVKEIRIDYQIELS